MEQICGVFATSGRAVPVFCDKHLSWNWHDAAWMIGRARDLGVPFMAGIAMGGKVILMHPCIVP
jgi:hypothetical protein